MKQWNVPVVMIVNADTKEEAAQAAEHAVTVAPFLGHNDTVEQVAVLGVAIVEVVAAQ